MYALTDGRAGVLMQTLLDTAESKPYLYTGVYIYTYIHINTAKAVKELTLHRQP